MAPPVGGRRGASADNGPKAAHVLAAALAVSVLLHVGTWTECRTERALRAEQDELAGLDPVAGGRPCTIAAAREAEGAAARLPPRQSTAKCDCADEVQAATLLKFKLERRDAELAAAKKDAKALLAELERAPGAGAAASDAARYEKELAELRVALKKAQRAAQDAQEEATKAKQALAVDAGEGRALPKALETCKQVESERSKLDEKVKLIKRELWDIRRKRETTCGPLLAADRLAWSDRLIGVMTAAVLAGNELAEETPAVLRRVAARRLAAVRREVGINAAGGFAFNGVAHTRNEEKLTATFRRGILEARDELLADGQAVDDAWVDRLLGLPEVKNAGQKSDGDKRLSAQERWEQAVKGITPKLLEGVEVKVEDQQEVARYVSRTVDAERAIPQLYEGVERDGGSLKWQTRFEKYQMSRQSRREKILHKQSGHTANGDYKGITRVVGRLGAVDNIYAENAPPEYRRCALVGNSQRSLIHEYGDEIDSHDTVFRMNNAPTNGYEKFVGKRTTHRIINNQWASQYGAPINRLGRLPLEWNVTLMVSRADHAQFYATAQAVKQRRPDVSIVRLSAEASTKAGALLAALRERVEKARGLSYSGKGSPSSGWLSVFIAMQLCEEVDVYGIGMGGCWGSSGGGCVGGSTWHYFEEDIKELSEKSREFGEDPHHSFQLEHDMLRALEAGGHIRLRQPQRYNTIGEEAKYLRAKMPKLIREAQVGAMTSKARADMQCVAATGNTCGCPKQCVAPNEAHIKEGKLRLKEATVVLQGDERR